MNIPKSLKPVSIKVKDPVRYPNVINPIEDKAKRQFERQMGKMIVDLTKEMVNIKKK